MLETNFFSNSYSDYLVDAEWTATAVRNNQFAYILLNITAPPSTIAIEFIQAIEGGASNDSLTTSSSGYYSNERSETYFSDPDPVLRTAVSQMANNWGAWIYVPFSAFNAAKRNQECQQCTYTSFFVVLSAAFSYLNVAFAVWTYIMYLIVNHDRTAAPAAAAVPPSNSIPLAPSEKSSIIMHENPAVSAMSVP